MSRFDRYMLSQLMSVFGFFSLILVAVYWVNRAVALFDAIIGSGQSALVFLELSALTLPNVIRIVLPISAFAGAVFVTNRLSTESELVVMQSTGFSPWRLARPVLTFGLFVAVVLSLLTHWLVPASRAQYAVRSTEIAENVSARLLVEGRFLHPSGGITFYIRDITPSGELLDVFFSDSRDEKRRTFYTAKRALVVRGETGPLLIMLDGMAQTYLVTENRVSVTRFKDFTYDVGALIKVTTRANTDLRALPTRALVNPDAELIAVMRQDSAYPFHRELHSRLAAPLLAPVAAMLGFATLLMAAFSRFGLWRQVMVAVVLLIVVQFLDNLAANLARKPQFWLALYLPAVIGGAMAAGMLWWTGLPSRRRATRVPA